MYGFLVLLPLTIISVLIGAFILLSPQLADYVVFITEVNAPAGKTVWQYFLDRIPYWTRIASHLVAYCIMCFVLIATVHNVDAVAGDRVMECGARILGNKSEVGLSPRIIGVTKQFSPELL